MGTNKNGDPPEFVDSCGVGDVSYPMDSADGAQIQQMEDMIS